MHTRLTILILCLALTASTACEDKANTTNDPSPRDPDKPAKDAPIEEAPVADTPETQPAEPAKVAHEEVSATFSCIEPMLLPKKDVLIIRDAAGLDPILGKLGEEDLTRCGKLSDKVDFEKKTLLAYMASGTCEFDEKHDVVAGDGGALTVRSTQISIGSCEVMGMGGVWIAVDKLAPEAKVALDITRESRDEAK